MCVWNFGETNCFLICAFLLQFQKPITTIAKFNRSGLVCLLNDFFFLCVANAEFTDDKSQGGKIVHGDLADIADFPFQVGIGSKKTRFFCGGAIVAPKIIFTAAHCTTITPTQFPRKGLRVFAGADRVDDPNAKFYEVAKIHVHPKWSYFMFVVEWWGGKVIFANQRDLIAG